MPPSRRSTAIRQVDIGKSTDKKELERTFIKNTFAYGFASLHELLRSTYDEMMPLCAQMTGIAKGIAGLGALFLYCSSGMGFHCPCRGDRCFSASPPLRVGLLYHVLPDSRTRYDERRALAHSAGTEMMVHQQEGILPSLLPSETSCKRKPTLEILKQPTLSPTRSSMRR